MKRRDIIMIIISVIVVVIAGALLYRYLFPPTADSNIKVVIPHPVDPNFNQEQLNVLKNDVVDFSQNITPTDTKPQKSSTQSLEGVPTTTNSPQKEAQQVGGRSASTRDSGR